MKFNSLGKGKMKSMVFCFIFFFLSSIFVMPNAEAAAKYTFKFATYSPGLMEWWDYVGKKVVKFSELVKERTNGEVEIKIFYANPFGGDEAMYKLLRDGSLDMATLHMLSSWDKRINVFMPPYLVMEWDEVRRLYRGNGYCAKRGHDILLEHGVKQLAMEDYSFRGIGNTKRPVKRPSDVNGLKLRVPSFPLYLKFFEGLGAKCIPMPYTEIYTAMQRGTVDGHDNAPLTAYTFKYLEIPTYYTEINWSYSPQLNVMSKKIWDPLPQNIKDALKSSAEDTAEYAAKLVDDAYKQVRVEAENKYATKFYSLTSEDKKAWREYGWTLWPWVEEQSGTDEFLALLKAAMNAGIPIPETYKVRISK